MFDSLDQAYECLTNRLWREIIRAISESQTKIIGLLQLFAYYPKNKEHSARLKSALRFDKIEGYMKSNFEDSLECLVNKNIFFQVHTWRCELCGHSNARSLDKLKKNNSCEICKSEYVAPIEIEWKFKINNFVSRALFESNGLTVIWALGFLHDSPACSNFYFMPELKLFDKGDDKKPTAEIDILCVISGQFYVIEVKKSVLAFTDKDGELDKYIEVIKRIRPDVALLAFEQYSDDPIQSADAKEKLTKALEQIKNCGVIGLEVKSIVASDNVEFNEYPIQLHPIGKRIRKFYE